MQADLRNLEKLFRNANNFAQWLDVFDTLRDGIRMIGAGSIQNVLLLLNLCVRPLLMQRARELEDGGEDTEKAESSNSLLVYDVEFVADRGNGKTSTSGQDRGL